MNQEEYRSMEELENAPHIPVDDISMVYAESSSEIQKIVTGILQAEEHVCVSGSEDALQVSILGPPDVTVVCVEILVRVGLERYGKEWLSVLKKLISQIQ